MKYINKLIKLAKKLDHLEKYKLASNIDSLIQKYIDGNGLVTQCAWCNALLNPATQEYEWDASLGEPRNVSIEKIRSSHGVCPECRLQLLEQIEELKKSKETNSTTDVFHE